jgi:hypothetical protein
MKLCDHLCIVNAPKTTVFGTPSDGSHLPKRSKNTLGPAH